MRISYQSLQKCTVQTVSGEVLGKIIDMIYDIESFTLVQIVVAGGMLKSHLYHIHPNQIVSITNSCITVHDTVERIVDEQTLSSRTAGTSTAMMRELE